ncbi:MAG: LysR family transcriptional regulator [Opitutales bacterium]
MELYQLRSFIAIAEMGNFTRAAAKLSTTQPTLSQQIINLEKELGHKLFHRLGRRAVLTETGQIFLNRARRITLEADNAAKELRDHPGLDRRITVGAIASVAPYFLPPLIAQARIDYPNLEIHAHEDFRSPLIREVLEGELDLAIVASPVHEPALSVEPLIREPLLLVVGPQHRFTQMPKVNAADLAGETFVMLGRSSSLYDQVRTFCGDHRFEPRIGFRCAQIATVKALVAMGAGIAILPRITQSSKDLDTLVYLRLADSSPERELVVVRHLQRYQSRGVTQFLTMLKAGVPLRAHH